ELQAVGPQVAQQPEHYALVVALLERLAVLVAHALLAHGLAACPLVGLVGVLGGLHRVIGQVGIQQVRWAAVHAASRSDSSCCRRSTSAYQPSSATSSSWVPCSTILPSSRTRILSTF